MLFHSFHCRLEHNAFNGFRPVNSIFHRPVLFDLWPVAISQRIFMKPFTNSGNSLATVGSISTPVTFKWKISKSKHLHTWFTICWISWESIWLTPFDSISQARQVKRSTQSTIRIFIRYWRPTDSADSRCITHFIPATFIDANFKAIGDPHRRLNRTSQQSVFMRFHGSEGEMILERWTHSWLSKSLSEPGLEIGGHMLGSRQSQKGENSRALSHQDYRCHFFSYCSNYEILQNNPLSWILAEIPPKHSAQWEQWTNEYYQQGS